MIGLSAALASRHEDERAFCVAQLLSIDTVAARASVSIDGGPAVSLPYVPNTYTGITTVYVLRGRGGSGQLVIGPAGQQAAVDVPTPPPSDPAPSAVVTATALIRPTWSGSWRSSVSSYDRWNVDRYGGRSTLYQGNAYGSGPMTGLAVYGDQVLNLRALSITQILVTTKIVTGSGSPQVQGSAMGTQPGLNTAPTTASTTTASRSGSGTISLPSDMCEAFRTGSMKGLVLNGSSYLAVYGTAYASGMALSITYTKQG